MKIVCSWWIVNATAVKGIVLGALDFYIKSSAVSIMFLITWDHNTMPTIFALVVLASDLAISLLWTAHRPCIVTFAVGFRVVFIASWCHLLSMIQNYGEIESYTLDWFLFLINADGCRSQGCVQMDWVPPKTATTFCPYSLGF